MRKPSHIHTPDDGRGPRQVYLDGVPVYRVLYADTRKGKLRLHPEPYKMDRWRKRVIEKTLYGAITIRFLGQ